MNYIAQIEDAFSSAFGHKPQWLVRAPGRVNLIGEHTDYNQGFVLPLAIDRFTWLAMAPRQDGVCRALSLDVAGSVSFETGQPVHGAGWGEYIKGVAWAMASGGLPLAGWDGLVKSDLPMGGGLASSAALEMAAARAFALTSLIEWDGRGMAERSQNAERQWVGVQCGIMDQLAVAEGRSGCVMLIDCRSLDLVHYPLPAGYSVVVMDTGTRRDLVGSAYNTRQSECAEAARLLGVSALREADLTMLSESGNRMPPALVRRARHVITENARTLAAAAAMDRGDAMALGQLIHESHASLRDDFQVSTPHLDVIVALAEKQPGCVGARLTGAGFGGCAVALVRIGEAARFCESVAKGYAERTGIEPAIRACAPSAGVAAARWQDAATLLPHQRVLGS